MKIILMLYLPKVLILWFSVNFCSDMVILGFYDKLRVRDTITDAEERLKKAGGC